MTQWASLIEVLTEIRNELTEIKAALKAANKHRTDEQKGRDRRSRSMG